MIEVVRFEKTAGKSGLSCDRSLEPARRTLNDKTYSRRERPVDPSNWKSGTAIGHIEEMYRIDPLGQNAQSATSGDGVAAGSRGIEGTRACENRRGRLAAQLNLVGKKSVGRCCGAHRMVVIASCHSHTTDGRLETLVVVVRSRKAVGCQVWRWHRQSGCLRQVLRKARVASDENWALRCHAPLLDGNRRHCENRNVVQAKAERLAT